MKNKLILTILSAAVLGAMVFTGCGTEDVTEDVSAETVETSDAEEVAEETGDVTEEEAVEEEPDTSEVRTWTVTGYDTQVYCGLTMAAYEVYQIEDESGLTSTITWIAPITSEGELFVDDVNKEYGTHYEVGDTFEMSLDEIEANEEAAAEDVESMREFYDKMIENGDGDYLTREWDNDEAAIYEW